MSILECPECEGIDFAAVRTSRDAKGQPIRERRCRDCGTKVVTVEVPVDATFGALAEAIRDAARFRNRRKFGYKADGSGRRPVSRWVRSSTEVISEGQESRGPAARELRSQGLTYQQIADRLGISKHTVYEHCHGRAKPWSPEEEVA